VVDALKTQDASQPAANQIIQDSGKTRTKYFLSQEEIDGILDVINSSDAANEPCDVTEKFKSCHRNLNTEGARMIKIHDFKRPDRFSKYIKELKVIHEILAQVWSELFKQNAIDIQIKFLSADSLNYDEFIRSVPNPSFFIVSRGIVNSVPVPLAFVIEVDPSLSVEQSVLNDLSCSLLKEYSQVWNKRYDTHLEFSRKSTETNPELLNLDSPQEMGLLITMIAKMDNKESMVNIYLPYLFLRPILPHLLKEKNRNAPEKKQEEDTMTNRYKPTIETGLDKLKAQVVVELGRTVKTLKEIKELEEFSIMELDACAGEAVSIFVNNTLFAQGEVVVINDNFGIRFLEFFEEKPEKQEAT
jgi:flagellar motor switch protein FliN